MTTGMLPMSMVQEVETVVSEGDARMDERNGETFDEPIISFPEFGRACQIGRK
jgi:hypothetical protein